MWKDEEKRDSVYRDLAPINSIKPEEESIRALRWDKTEMYDKFDTMLKEVDEEYRTTIINFVKYKLVMFVMAKI